MQGVIIRDNICRRTLKLPASTFADWGFGAPMQQGVFYDQAVTDAHLRATIGIYMPRADAMIDVTVSGNIVEHSTTAIYLGGSSSDELGLRGGMVSGNILRDCLQYGLFVFPNAAKHTDLNVIDNLIDCDPYRLNANSNMDGSYDASARRRRSSCKRRKA